MTPGSANFVAAALALVLAMIWSGMGFFILVIAADGMVTTHGVLVFGGLLVMVVAPVLVVLFLVSVAYGILQRGRLLKKYAGFIAFALMAICIGATFSVNGVI